MRRSSLLLAVLALLVAGAVGDALVGDAYSAAKRLISGKSIKKGSIPANRLSAKARRTLKGARGPTGPAGPAGAPGRPGATGPKGDTGATGTVDTSNFYDKAASDARFAGKGAFTVFLSSGAWYPSSPGGLTAERSFDGGMSFTSSTVKHDVAFYQQPDIPTVANGKRLRLQQVRYCYSNPNMDGTRLDHFEVSWLFPNDPDGMPSMESVVADATDRTDLGCRTLTAPGGGVELTPDSSVLFLARVDFLQAPATFWLLGTWVTLVPSETDA